MLSDAIAVVIRLGLILLIGLAATAFPGRPAQAQTSAATATSEEQRKAEELAAWKAALQARVSSPQEVTLLDQGVFTVPAPFFFIPKAEGARLMRAWGNTVNASSFAGLVASPKHGDEWIAEISFIKEGYVKDDDARNWNADDLLTSLKEGTDAANEDRRARGFPELEILGWVEKPAYDSTTHRLVWSMSAKQKNQPDGGGQSVNYNTYLLGREGYFSLDFITSSDRIAAEKATARDLLARLSFASGKRYEDFDSSTDKIAAYGLAALVGGLAAKKLGLLALAGVFVLKFAKIIGLAAVGIVMGVAKFFRGRSRQNGPQV
ncbi:Uncharacterized membrane-anchored protein [Rhizobiales bacterium GAS113]|nr:Uncharacterized membrane-anchored protein [Rhizobiales bacterium GAS113]